MHYFCSKTWFFYILICINDGLPLKDHKKTNFGVKKIRPIWRVLLKRVGGNKKRKIWRLLSRRKYLYVPLQIVDVYTPLSLSSFNFCVSSRILCLRSIGITSLKSCVTVLLTVMRTNVLVLVCFIAGFAPYVAYCGE